MEVEFDSQDLDNLETDPGQSLGLGPAVDKGFRKVMQLIRAAADERDLYPLRGLRFEKLKGKRQHQYSLRINDQYRLIIELRGQGAKKRIGVVEIVDYH
jgi:toxin HigB-1